MRNSEDFDVVELAARIRDTCVRQYPKAFEAVGPSVAAMLLVVPPGTVVVIHNPAHEDGVDSSIYRKCASLVLDLVEGDSPDEGWTQLPDGPGFYTWLGTPLALARDPKARLPVSEMPPLHGDPGWS